MIKLNMLMKLGKNKVHISVFWKNFKRIHKKLHNLQVNVCIVTLCHLIQYFINSSQDNVI